MHKYAISGNHHVGAGHNFLFFI